MHTPRGRPPESGASQSHPSVGPRHSRSNRDGRSTGAGADRACRARGRGTPRRLGGDSPRPSRPHITEDYRMFARRAYVASLLAAAVLTLSTAAQAAPTTWTIDPNHSNVTFTIR